MDTARKTWYFTPFEGREPPPPSGHSRWRETLWQVLATLSIVLGLWYLHWRWTESLNLGALWFSLPLTLAETLAFVGLALFVFNLWQIADTPRRPPPRFHSECGGEVDRPLAVDIFVATYSEDPELVRISLEAAKALRYPHPIDIKVHCLDDGRRDAMREVAEDVGVNYVVRTDNVGFKAGNLRNAIGVTSGDILVICDADTRLFPQFLEETLGYFRDPDVAWVQTPQWFYDLPEGERLDRVWGRRFGPPGKWAANGLQALVGEIRKGSDPFDNGATFFYDAIQRRRNGANASFCCGAGSIHRRDAVLESAVRAYADRVNRRVDQLVNEVKDPESRQALEETVRLQYALDEEIVPYKFHVSEDIYTSIVLHGDPERPWKSVYHPGILSKMLSPQDMSSWVVQRYKYAAGTLDIALHDNPLFRYNLTASQRVMYSATIWSYLSSLWNWIFIVSPTIYLFTAIPPVSSFSLEFFKHFIPFVLSYELALVVGTWGIPNAKGRAFYMGFFPYGLRAFWTALRGKPIRFPVTPKERQTGVFLSLVRWQIALIVLIWAGIVWATIFIVLGIRADVSGYVINVLWGLYTISLLWGVVRAATWRPAATEGAR